VGWVEGRRQETEDRRQETEDRIQETEDRIQETEDRIQETEDRRRIPKEWGCKQVKPRGGGMQGNAELGNADAVGMGVFNVFLCHVLRCVPLLIGFY